MSVDQALEHDWLNDPKLADAKLSIDCLREFKYKHKWLVSIYNYLFAGVVVTVISSS